MEHGNEASVSTGNVVNHINIHGVFMEAIWPIGKHNRSCGSVVMDIK